MADTFRVHRCAVAYVGPVASTWIERCDGFFPRVQSPPDIVIDVRETIEIPATELHKHDVGELSGAFSVGEVKLGDERDVLLHVVFGDPIHCELKVREVERDRLESMFSLALAIAFWKHGQFHVHAGAVFRGASDVRLFVGGSGAGKSTCTMAHVAAGFGLLSDDFVWLSRNAGLLDVASLPLAIHVGGRSRDVFSSLFAAELQPMINGKWSFFSKPWWDARARMHIENAEIELVFTGIIDAETSWVREVPRNKAFGALLESSAWTQLPPFSGEVSEHLGVLGDVVNRARCLALGIARDALTNPQIIVDLLERHSQWQQ